LRAVSPAAFCQMLASACAAISSSRENFCSASLTAQNVTFPSAVI